MLFVRDPPVLTARFFDYLTIPPFISTMLLKGLFTYEGGFWY